MPISYQFRVPDEITEFIKGVHPQLKRKIKSALQLILSDSCQGKSLKDDLSGLKSFKVGRFRIIYRISSKNVIDIVAVGPRRVIYELTYHIVKKEAQGKE